LFVVGGKELWRPFSKVSMARSAEACALCVSLVSVGAAIFVGSETLVARSPWRVYAPLPWLLWAAVRFGVAGVSLSMFALMVLVIVGARGGHGPFVGGSPAENLLEVQLFLVATSMPLLLLSALARQQRHTAEALRASESAARERVAQLADLIAERALAEAALRESAGRVRELASRLISTQEAERTRIAMDLHDGVSQRLAALSLGLSALRRHVGDGEGLEQLERLQSGAAAVAAELRGISHELHPGALRHTGLAMTLAGLCREMDGKNGTSVAFAGDGELPSLAPEASLCLYRLAQEALHNVMVHAKATRATVTLGNGDGRLKLIVSDDGRGFDAQAARASGGVGLLSMEERARLLGGTFRIDTRPGRGTELYVEVPVRRVGEAGSSGSQELAPARDDGEGQQAQGRHSPE
jgi:two-component system sensor histidine kinase UhpB